MWRMENNKPNAPAASGQPEEIPSFDDSWFPSASQLMEGIVLGKMPANTLNTTKIVAVAEPELASATPGRLRRLLIRKRTDW